MRFTRTFRPDNTTLSFFFSGLRQISFAISSINSDSPRKLISLLWPWIIYIGAACGPLLNLKKETVAISKLEVWKWKPNKTPIKKTELRWKTWTIVNRPFLINSPSLNLPLGKHHKFSDYPLFVHENIKKNPTKPEYSIMPNMHNTCTPKDERWKLFFSLESLNLIGCVWSGNLEKLFSHNFQTLSTKVPTKK